jgi:hypothetical protein
MIAFHFVLQRKLWLFLLTVVVAWSFHSSSIFFLLAWPLSLLPYRRSYNWLFLFIFIITFILAPIIFNFLVQFSRLDYEAGAGGGERMLIYYILLFLCSLFISVNKLQQQENKVYLYLLMYTTLIWMIGMNLAAIFRLAAYSEFFLALYISNTILEMKPNIVKVIALYGILFVSIALFILLSIAPRGMDYPVYPYYFLWENAKL